MVVENPIMELVIRAGLEPDQSAAGSVADFVYGFQRTAVANNGEWSLADTGDRSDGLAIAARHRALVIQASKPFLLESASPRLAKTPGNTQLPRWRLVVDPGLLRPGESQYIQHVVSALPTNQATLQQAGHPRLCLLDNGFHSERCIVASRMFSLCSPV